MSNPSKSSNSSPTRAALEGEVRIARHRWWNERDSACGETCEQCNVNIDAWAAAVTALARYDAIGECMIAPEAIANLRAMLDHAERWIDHRWLGEWKEHAYAKATVDALAALDALRGTP